MKILNVAVIGYGLSGRVFHAPLIATNPHFRLTRIYSSKQDSAFEIQSKYPDCEHTFDINDVFEDDIDLVVVTSPNRFHFSLAKRAIEARKHVVVEKPFTVNSSEARELSEMSKSGKLACSVFHNRRWDSDFKTIKKVIDSQKLGDLREYEAHFDRFRNYKKLNAWKEDDQEPGAGILYDLGSHLIDQALHLFGAPQEIYADIRSQRPGVEVDDNFEIILYYENLKVTLKAGMLVKSRLPKFTLFGTQGSFTKYGMDVQESQSRNGMDPSHHEWGIEKKEDEGGIEYIENEQDVSKNIPTEKGDYPAFYKSLYQTIINGLDPEVSSEDGHNVIKLIELAKESNQTKRRLTVTGLL